MIRPEGRDPQEALAARPRPCEHDLTAVGRPRRLVAVVHPRHLDPCPAGGRDQVHLTVSRRAPGGREGGDVGDAPPARRPGGRHGELVRRRDQSAPRSVGAADDEGRALVGVQGLGEVVGEQTPVRRPGDRCRRDGPVRDGGDMSPTHVHDEHVPVAAVRAHDDREARPVRRPRESADHLAAGRAVDGGGVVPLRRRDLDDGRIGSAGRHGVCDLSAPGVSARRPPAAGARGVVVLRLRVRVAVRHDQRDEPRDRRGERQPDDPALQDGLEALHVPKRPTGRTSLAGTPRRGRSLELGSGDCCSDHLRR